MKKRIQINKMQKSETLFYGMIAAIGIVILLAGIAVGRRFCLAEARKTYGVTVNYLKNQCGEYDNFLDADNAKSLIRITEHADDIGRMLELLNGEEKEKRLHEYLTTKRLDCIILTDGNMNAEEKYISSGADAVELLSYVPRDAVKEIAEHPVKIYSDRVNANGGFCDIAAAARHDKQGLVLCFRLQDGESMRNYYSSVRKLLAGDETVFNGTMVITENGKIISSNRSEMIGAESGVKVLELLDDKAATGNIVKITDGKSEYYGGKAVYKRYGIYVYYPVTEVFAGSFNIMALAVCVYFAIILFMIVFYQRSRYLHACEINEQYEIIRTISRMFLFNMFVDMKENKFRFLLRSSDFADVDENCAADDILSNRFTNYAAEEYRESYRSFSDLSTLRQRLEGRDYIEIEYLSINGEWLNDIIIPKRNGKNGDFDSFLLVTKNINEQKKTEMEYQRRLEEAMRSEMRANEAKTNLLRRMSHDIRTPINAILGMIEIADRNVGNFEKQKYCRSQGRVAAEYLLELVNDILTLNRIEADDKTEVCTAFDLHDEAEKIFTIVNMRAENAGVKLNAPGISCSGRQLYGNVLYFHQIVINILINAVKYSNKGGEVDFSFSEEKDDNGAKVRFVCKDGGIGMSREFQQRMFEPFAQENNEEIKPYGGLGLGLAIVKILTEKLGGTLSAESEKGSGTVFEITLPFKYAPETEIKAENENYSIKGLRILIAEDNHINMEIAEYLAGEAGAETVPAFDGKEAIDIFAASGINEFDAVLMDITMPVIDGLEATKRIRALDRKDAETVPIIAMTANLFIRDIEKCFSVGMNGYVPKPINEKQLVKIIAEKCAERKQNEA